jgi:NAD(P)-dependent dehydrogenase (short-subunit alcohol dehydrogenase family)
MKLFRAQRKFIRFRNLYRIYKGEEMKILVTGSSSGIGAALLPILANKGHQVIATARHPERISKFENVAAYSLDVTKLEDIRKLYEQIGSVDVLINNAAIETLGPLETFPLADGKAMFETNFWGPLQLIQTFLPGMRERGQGVIINVSSVGAKVGLPFNGPYQASKAALELLGEILAFEAGHFGIRVHNVQPGAVATRMLEHSLTYAEETTSPYEPLAKQWKAVLSQSSAGALSPEVVAEGIAQVLEDKDAPLRIPMGEDAKDVLGARAQMTDEAFTAMLKETMNLSW